MPDAYDRLRRLQTLRGKEGPRYLLSPSSSQPPPPLTSPPVSPPVSPPASPGPTPPSPAPGGNIPTNSQTFLATRGGGVSRFSGSYGSGGRLHTPPPLPWPPAGMFVVWSAKDPPYEIEAGKRYNPSYPAGNDMFEVVVALIKFDTSSLPDTAQITGAALRLHGFTLITGPEDRNLTADWVSSWTEPNGADADWTANEGTNAHTGTPLKNLPTWPGWAEFPLINGANISKTAPTFLRVHVSGGAMVNIPAYSTYTWHFRGGGYDDNGFNPGGGPATAPQLVVTYA